MSDNLSLAGMLSVTPADYLKDGFYNESGTLRPELTGMKAFAIASQFSQALTPPQEVTLTLEGLRQVLPLHAGEQAEQFAGSVTETLEMVARILGQANNARLKSWLNDCAPFVKTEADIEGFLS